MFVEIFSRAVFLAIAAGGGAMAQEVPGKTEERAKVQPDRATESAADWKVHWQIQAVALSAAKARAVIPELRDETTAAAGWEKVQAMLRDETAENAIDAHGQMLAGMESKYVEGERYLFRNYYDDLEIIRPRRADGVPEAITSPKAGESFGVANPPVGADGRDVGLSATVSAVVRVDGRRLMVTSEIERSWFVRWDEFEAGRYPNNETIIRKAPRIVSLRRKSTSPMLAGECALLSAHPVPGAEGRMELLLLRVWTTRRAGEEAKK